MEYNGKEIYIGFAKEPLMPAPNFGYLGVKIQNPERTHIMCNECGVFFKRLHTKHLQKHGLTIDEYRRKNGFSLTTSLISDTESLNISKNILGRPHSINNNEEALEKRAENHKKSLEEGKSVWENSMDRKNKFGTCPEQIKDRLKNYIERYGRLPTYNGIGEDGKALYSLLKHKYKDVNKGFLEYGLPTKILKPGAYVEYTFKDGIKIRAGYNYDNWDKIVEKIKQTSLLFI